MPRKRNSSSPVKLPDTAPALTKPPTIEEAIAVLSYALNYISQSGIRIEWVNHNGNLILTFKGIMLETNKEAGTARFVKSADYIADVAYKAIKERSLGK